MDGAANDVSEHYLQGGLNALGHAEWHDLANAPGNEFVRLKSLSVSCDGMERGRVDIQKDFEVAIEYYVLANCRGINVGLHLCNARGEPVISSGNLKSCSSSYDPWVERVYPPGLYRTSCFFPGCLLNDGRYSLSFDVNDYSAYRSHVHVVDALKFEVVDTGYMREEYHGPWPGSFRMKLPWSTKLLTTSVSR
jgi:lipopolysaccharide transport system ATP-binding protein